jgi:hypothetical protein
MSADMACLLAVLLSCCHTGVKSSGAVVKVFRHNDMAHLEKLLRFHIAEGQARTHRPWKKVSACMLGIACAYR